MEHLKFVRYFIMTPLLIHDGNKEINKKLKLRSIAKHQTGVFLSYDAAKLSI